MRCFATLFLGAAVAAAGASPAAHSTVGNIASMTAGAAPDAAPAIADLNQMRSRDLKKLLRTRGVDTWGLLQKEDLVAALIPLLERETPAAQERAAAAWEAGELQREEQAAAAKVLAEAGKRAAAQTARAERMRARGAVQRAHELEEQARYELASVKAMELAAAAMAANATAAKNNATTA